MSENDTLLDIKEAARFLNVSETSLRRWTNSGRLKCLRIGRRRERRFRRLDLLAFLEQPSNERSTERSTERSAVLNPPTGQLVTDPPRDSLADGTHLCGLYGSDLDRVRLAVGFLAAGLTDRTVCFVLGPQESRSRILSALMREIPEVSTRLESGQLVAADYQSSPDAQLAFLESRLSSAMRAGASSFRVVGDLTSFAQQAGAAALARYETGYASTIAKRYPVVTLCQYDVRRFAGPDILSALQAHPDTLTHPASVL